MENSDQEKREQFLPPVSNADAAIQHLRDGIASGKHWYIALLESIGMWTDDAEEVNGSSYFYLIEGEAFDYLLLAGRLCDAVDGMIPEEEKNDLLFKARAPIEVSTEDFKQLIGAKKYHQYLNYFYGVVVEEALIQEVREEVRKARRANGMNYNRNKEEEETYLRIYEELDSVLLKQFRKEKRYVPHTNSSLTEVKQFTYWCFKYRVKTGEKARVASDTNKALMWLKKHGSYYIK